LIRPKFDFKKYVKKYRKNQVRRHFKKGSSEAIKDYIKRLNIIPRPIVVSRSYKLSILLFLQTILSLKGLKVLDKVILEFKKILVSKNNSLAYVRKKQGENIIFKNKHKVHYRW
jgi:hypothetical protein